MERILCVLIGYICGLFQTSYLYGKVHGIDIRNYGSGNAGTTNALRTLGDRIRDSGSDVIALLAGINDDKGNFYCICSKSAVEKGAHAGKIIQHVAAITGGKGGGRPDSAMGGIGKSYMVDEALGMFDKIAGEFLKG